MKVRFETRAKLRHMVIARMVSFERWNVVEKGRITTVTCLACCTSLRLPCHGVAVLSPPRSTAC